MISKQCKANLKKEGEKKMKMFKKILLASVIGVSMVVMAPQMAKVLPGLESAYTVEAASVKINKKSKTIYEGNTYNLKITGTKKKVKWSTSNKKVATVDSKGKVKAKSNGKATITAKVGGKKYTCKVNVKLLQFDNTFYNLKDAAISYKYVGKIKNYQDFKYDLDGDGKKDKITVQKNKEYYTFKLNGKKFTESLKDAELYIVDLNKNDKTKEVIIRDGASEFGWGYVVYSKKGTKMKKVGNLDGSAGIREVRIDKKGKIVANNDELISAITPKIYNEYYEFKNKKIYVKNVNINKIKNVKLTINKKSVRGIYFSKKDQKYTVEECFKKINNGEENINKIEKALKIENLYSKKVEFKIKKILNSVGDGYKQYKVELNNGKKGYIYLIDFDRMMP